MRTEKEEHTYWFGDFRVDEGRRALFRDEQPIYLNPKAFDLLIALVERRGSVISKKELLEKLWKDQFVEEGNITVHMSALRKALGERKGEHRFIVTLPGQGYKFVGDVAVGNRGVVVENHFVSQITIEQKTSDTEKPAANAALKSGPARTILKKWRIAAALAGLVILTGLGGYSLRKTMSNDGDAAPPMSIKRLTSYGNVNQAAISPDGNFYAYSLIRNGKTTLWLGAVKGTDPVQLRPPDAGAVYQSISFTPDGGSFYYVLTDEKYPHGKLFKLSVLGGVPEELRENVGSVAIALDGKQIAFVRNDEVSGTSSVVVSDINSTNERVIVSRPIKLGFNASSLAWSSDGSTISVGAVTDDWIRTSVFLISVADQKIELMTDKTWGSVRSTTWLNDGSGIVAVADNNVPAGVAWQLYEIFRDGSVHEINPDLTSYASASVSADGKKLLAVQVQSQSNIWVAPTDDLSSAKQITFSAIGETDGWLGLDWMPDGKIVYMRLVDRSRSIWIMNGDGTNAAQLIRAGGGDFLPAVTADGRYVVFESARSGRSQIWRANADGTDLRQLTDLDVAAQPHVSPDEQWIVYISSGQHLGPLYRVSINGGNPVRLTESNVEGPRISPDNKFVACGYQIDETTKLAILSIDGGPPIKLFDLPHGASFTYGAHWTPDGKAIALRDWEDGIWIQPLDGGAPTHLKGLPHEKLYGYNWSPDGKYFAFTRGSDIRDAVIVSNFR